MKVSIKVDVNYKLIEELETTCVRNALELTALWLIGEINALEVVPKDTGELQDSVFYEFTHDSVVSILYSGPQVRRLYFNPQYNYRTDRNANAQGRWLDPWVVGDKSEDVKDKFQEFYTEEVSRLIK